MKRHGQLDGQGLRWFACLLLPVLLTGPARSQGHPLPPPPCPPPSPLLYVRVIGPNGLQATFYQGAPAGATFDTPVTVGFRPGYVYRFQLSHWEEEPNLLLFPSLEVIGSLQLPPRYRAAAYPAPVMLTDEDLQHVRDGALITKVIYLEHPDTATPVATNPDQPLEFRVERGQDPLAEARAKGRPMAVLRIGQRQASAEELIGQAIPGTVLLPGEKCLPHAARPPLLPWACVPLVDPSAGPRYPDEECLHDGGDEGARLGLDNDGKLHGLDPGDTAAEYSNSCGQRKVVTSNRVCLCVPRFVTLRAEVVLAGYDLAVGVVSRGGVKGQIQVQALQPSLETLQQEQLKGMNARLTPSGAVAVQKMDRLEFVQVLNGRVIEIGVADVLGSKGLRLLRAEQIVMLKRQIELARELSKPYGVQVVEQSIREAQVVGRVEQLGLVTAIQETRDLNVCCNEEPCAPDKPLVLFKWVNSCDVHVGDVVTFFLKYSNHGGKPITDVAVSDSLMGRLEYVPGSSNADRDAVFTMQENDAGSTVLRWEIGGKLLPGQSGVVSFQARVR